MAADPYAALADPYAGLAPAKDPYANLKPTQTPTTTIAENRSPASFANLFAHPVDTAGRLWDTIKASASSASKNYGLAGALSTAAAQGAGSAVSPELGSSVRAARTAERENEAALAPKGFLEHAVAIPAGIVGAAASPETMISGPAKLLGLASRPVEAALVKMGAGKIIPKLAGRAVAKGAEQAVVNAATDPAVQAVNIASGEQEGGYDPYRTLENAGFGAVAGAGLGAAEKGLGLHGEARASRKAVEEAYHGYNEGVIKDTGGRPVDMANPMADVSERAEATPAKGSIAEPVLPRVDEAHPVIDPYAGIPAAPLKGDPEEAPDVMASTKGGLRANPDPVILRAPDPTQIGDLETGVHQLTDNLLDSLGITARQGRIGMKGALGVYNRKSGVVRTLQVQNYLPVIAHEAGHALEFTTPHPELLKAMKAHAAELKPLDYDPKAQRRHEGFAEFLRWYITNPTHARVSAPGFYPAFEAAMAKDNPKAFQAFKDVQAGYQAYLNAPSAQRAKAHVVQQQKETWATDMAKRVRDEGIGAVLQSGYAGAVDRLDPLQRVTKGLLKAVEEHTGKTLELPVEKDPYKLARLAPNAYSAGHMDLVHGVAPYGSLDAATPGFSDALGTALEPRKWSADAIQEWDAYLTARRMVGEWDRYEAGRLAQPPDILKKGDYEAAIHDFEAANPTWPQAAQQLYAFQQGLWDKTRDAGFISEKTHAMGAEHPDYVPLLRDVSDRQMIGHNSGHTGTGRADGRTPQFKGSFRNVVSPTQSIMRNAYRLSAMIARNDAIAALDELAQAAGPLGGPYVERIPRKEMRPINVDALEALGNAAERLGMSERDVASLLDDVQLALGAEEAPATVFRAGDINERGEPIVYRWKDGVAHPLRLPDGVFGKEVYSAVTNMTPAQKSFWLDLAAWPARAMRAGIVTHPSFLIRNPLVDQLTTFLTTDVGFVPGLDFARGLYHEVRGTKLTEQYNRAGAIKGGIQSATERDARTDQSIKALRKKGIRVRKIASWKGFAEAAEVSETATRMGVFQKAMKKAKAAGMNDLAAAKEAAFEATDYMDFNRGGSHEAVKAAQKVDPFLRVWGLSMDKMVRTLSADGNLKEVLRPLLGGVPHTAAEKRAYRLATKAWATLSALSVGSLGLTALYRDDPEYQSFNDDLRATHWIVRNGQHWGLIPKPYEWGAMPDIAERMFEGVAEHDPSAWKRAASDMANIFLPPDDVPSMAIPFEIAGNRNSMGQPIIPEHLKNSVDPELQVAPNTSEVGKWLGKQLHVSPAVVDHVMTRVGASWVRSGLQLARGMNSAPMASAPEDTPVASRFVKDPAQGSRPAEVFWSKVSENGGEYFRREGTFRALAKDDPAKAVAYAAQLPPAERAYVLASWALPGQAQQIHPMIRAQKVVSILSDLRRGIRDGDIQTAPGDFTHLTPDERRGADTAIGKRIMAEQTNALIMAGEEGWAQRKLMPTDVQLPAGVEQALKMRMAINKVLDDTPELEAAWTGMKDILSDKIPNLQTMIEMREGKGMRGVRRALEQGQPAR